MRLPSTWLLGLGVAAGAFIFAATHSAATTSRLSVLPNDANPQPKTQGPGRALNLLFTPVSSPDGRMVRVEGVITPGYENDVRDELPGVPLSTLTRSRVVPLVWLSADQKYGVVGLTSDPFPWNAGDLLLARRKGA